MRPKTISCPAQYSVRAGRLVVRSDYKITENHAVIQELKTLGKQIHSTLHLPKQNRDVMVYVFSTPLEYHQYLTAHYPHLPNRRAYFVGSSKELAVYTSWGERIQEDLRHEYTHGLLHSCLPTVPLWLDEGLAEYFEVPGEKPGGVNPEYAHRLAAAIAQGWKPDLPRLEALDDFSQMKYADYQESWAWMHFLMNASPDTRQMLLEYLSDLRTNSNPIPLSQRLQNTLPQWDQRFLSYLTTMHSQQYLAAGPLSGAATVTDVPEFTPPQWAKFPQTQPITGDSQIQLVYHERMESTSTPATTQVTPAEQPGVATPVANVGQARIEQTQTQLSQLESPSPQETFPETDIQLAHRKGWQECVELFLDRTLDVTHQNAARRYGEQTRRNTSAALELSRLQGLEDCQQDLKKLVDQYGEEPVRQSLIAQKLMGSNGNSIPATATVPQEVPVFETETPSQPGTAQVPAVSPVPVEVAPTEKPEPIESFPPVEVTPPMDSFPPVDVAPPMDSFPPVEVAPLKQPPQPSGNATP